MGSTRRGTVIGGRAGDGRGRGTGFAAWGRRYILKGQEQGQSVLRGQGLVTEREPRASARVMPRKTATQGGRGPGLYPESRSRASDGPVNAPGDAEPSASPATGSGPRDSARANRARTIGAERSDCGSTSPLDRPRAELYWVSALILKSQNTQFAGGVRSAKPEARSSVVEHYLDTVGVDGSIPPAPTAYSGRSHRRPSTVVALSTSA